VHCRILVENKYKKTKHVGKRKRGKKKEEEKQHLMVTVLGGTADTITL